MEKLTAKQQAIYAYLQSFTAENGYPPTVREIGEHLSLKSPSTVHFHLKGLRDAGLIQLSEGKTRAITLTDCPLPRRGRVPILGDVAAGTPILAQECIDDYLAFDTGPHPEEYFALRVRGESMLGAGILPGDLIVVHQQPDAHNGEIVVALFEDEATVKTLQRRNGQVWLLPKNPAYSPINGTYARILGKVTAVIRHY